MHSFEDKSRAEPYGEEIKADIAAYTRGGGTAVIPRAGAGRTFERRAADIFDNEYEDAPYHAARYPEHRAYQFMHRFQQQRAAVYEEHPQICCAAQFPVAAYGRAKTCPKRFHHQAGRAVYCKSYKNIHKILLCRYLGFIHHLSSEKYLISPGLDYF